MMRMPWTVEPRTERAPLASLLAPLAAVSATVVVGLLLFTILGVPAGSAFRQLLIAPLSTPFNLGEVLLKATPLLLIAQGLAIGFRAKIWNIGAEGQLILGAIGASLLPIWFNDSTSPLMLPAMVVMGTCFGMAWAAIAATTSVIGR